MPLIEHFVSYHSREFHKPVKQISDTARDLLIQYDWPGNVRELLNTVERIMILEDGDIILPENLPPEIKRGKETTRNYSDSIIAKLANTMNGLNYQELTEKFQAILIKRALELSHGNKTEAAKILGIPRLGLYHQIKKLGMSIKG